jgi:hypothetical protein
MRSKLVANRINIHSKGNLPMSTEGNKTFVRRFFEEIVNAKQLSVADELFAADHQYHDPSSPMIGPGPER